MLRKSDPLTRSKMYTTVNVNGVDEKDFLSNRFRNYDTDNFTYFTVSKYNKSRPDLIALETLGDEKYWWCILEFNNIQNPFTDLQPGMKIKIPIFTESIDNFIRNN